MVNGQILCRTANCQYCAASPKEFAPVHFDCFEIFKQQCSVSASGDDLLNRLWILAAWRNPWRGAQPIHFSTPLVDKDLLITISGFCGLPHLYTLPLELLEMIRQLSKHSLLWTCISAFRLVNYISAIKPETLWTFPLSHILLWERQGEVKLIIGDRSSLPTLRLTVDSAGISKIERLPGPPTYAGECISNNFSFIIVQDDVSISQVEA